MTHENPLGEIHPNVRHHNQRGNTQPGEDQENSPPSEGYVHEQSPVADIRVRKQGNDVIIEGDSVALEAAMLQMRQLLASIGSLPVFILQDIIC